MNVTPLRRLSCEQVLEDLPWYVNGTLASATRLGVEQHLSVCARCSESLEVERRIRSSLEIADSDSSHNGPRAWEKFAAQLPVARPRQRQWLYVLLAAQAAAIAVLAILLAQRTPPVPVSQYRTVASRDEAAVAGAPFLRVSFAPAVTVVEASRLFDALGLRIIVGPSDQNVYALGVRETPAAASPGDATTLARSLQLLRSYSQVQFAEMIDPELRP